MDHKQTDGTNLLPHLNLEHLSKLKLGSHMTVGNLRLLLSKQIRFWSLVGSAVEIVNIYTGLLSEKVKPEYESSFYSFNFYDEHFLFRSSSLRLRV